MAEPDDLLDALLADARRQTADHSAALMARVVADADAAMPVIAAPEPAQSWGASFFAMFGGWPALSGVAAAGIAGLWVGLAPPAGVESLLSVVMGTTTDVSILPDFDGFDWSETLDG